MPNYLLSPYLWKAKYHRPKRQLHPESGFSIKTVTRKLMNSCFYLLLIMLGVLPRLVRYVSITCSVAWLRRPYVISPQLYCDFWWRCIRIIIIWIVWVELQHQLLELQKKVKGS